MNAAGTPRPGGQGTILALLAQDQEWMADGSCTGLVTSAEDDPWFAEKPERQRAMLAQRICRDCPVVTECLEFALDGKIAWGIWGATTPWQRRKMLRARGQELAA